MFTFRYEYFYLCIFYGVLSYFNENEYRFTKRKVRLDWILLLML